MALRQLILRKKIEAAKTQLNTLRAKDADFLTRKKELETREAELETAVEEVTDETPDDEKASVEESVTAFETDKKAYDEEQAGHDAAKSELETEIQGLEAELKDLDERSKPKPAAAPTPAADERKDDKPMDRRARFFKGMNIEQRKALLARDEVKTFAQRVREAIGQKRAITGAGLLIPEVLLDMMRDNISEYSKLITKVNYKPIKGKARQNVAGTIPEAVWTEMLGALNELEISFNQVEVDGYMVGGFVPVPNTTIEDSDENLVSDVMVALAKAIGRALDKAIPYGLGTKQPLGFVTRLAQTSKPVNYSADAPEWKDLHTTHITKVSTTGAALIGSIITAFAACKNDYTDGRKFFCMNSVTYAYLVSTLLNFNAAGALATGMSNQMPILGGDIVILEFIEDYDIIGGYGDLYLLVEREGTVLESSEHVRFIQHQTVFKGLARYDGLPVIAEAFFVININNENAATTATFEKDYANTELGALTVTSAQGTASGDSLVTVGGTEVSGTTLGYKIGGRTASVKSGDSKDGYTALTSPAQVTVATGKVITVVEFDGNGRAIKIGSAQTVSKP